MYDLSYHSHEAVDLILIGTGVAYCNVATGEETVRWIQKWPGKANAVENKVSDQGSNTSHDINGD